MRSTSNQLPFVALRKRREGGNEVLVETFIRKMLRLKAHRVTAVEMKAEQMVIRIDRLARRRLSCRGCGRPCGRIHQVEAARNWQHLSFWGVPVVLHYQPRRVRC